MSWNPIASLPQSEDPERTMKWWTLLGREEAGDYEIKTDQKGPDLTGVTRTPRLLTK